MKPSIDLKLLGEARLSLRNAGQAFEHHLAPEKTYFLLAYLAIKQDWLSREHLADLFWGETSSSSARRNLRKILFKIRAFDWFDDFEEDVPGIRWQVQTDVADFQNAIKDKDWQNAIKHYQGRLLEGLEIKGSQHFAEWLELERMRLEQLYLEARECYAAELEAQGELEKALEVLKESLSFDQLNEAVHRSIMRLEYKLGNSEAVFEQFEMLRESLKRDLGVEPLEETVAYLKELEQGGASQGRSALIIENAKDVPQQAAKLLGREQLLKEALVDLHKHKRLLIHGFGGMGKTAFAAALTSQYLNAESTKALWLQMGSDASELVFDALAQGLNARQDLAQSQDRSRTLKALLEQAGISLIVLDDVWNAYSLSKLTEAIPETCLLLVTSRQRYPKLKRILLAKLDRNAALELLSLHAESPFKHDPQADKLCHLLGDHAFAIRIAGLTLKETKASLKTFITQIKNAPYDLKIPHDFEKESRQSVASLLNVSLEPLDDLPYETFLSFGILSSSSASPQLLANCLRRSSEEVENALFTLSQRGLAERISKAGSDLVSYRIHDLAHAYAKANKFQRPTTLITAGLEYLRKYKDDLELLDLEITNLLGAAQQTKDLGKQKALIEYMDLLSLKGNYYLAKGHSESSVKLLKVAVRVATDLKQLAKARDFAGKLGDYYRSFKGQPQKALEWYQLALSLAQESQNLSREAVFTGLMAAVLSEQKDEAAKAYLAKAYDLAKKSKDDLCLSIVLDQMAYATGVAGDFKASKVLLLETLSVIERLEQAGQHLDELDRNRFYTLLNLGEAEFRLGFFQQGLSYRQQALGIAQEKNHSLWIAYAHFEIAEMYQLNACKKLAEKHMHKALEYFQQSNATKDIEKVHDFLKQAGLTIPT